MTRARKLALGALAAGTLLISAGAAVKAGLTEEANVTVTILSKTAAIAYGSVGTARASLISKLGSQAIGCKIEATAAGSNVRCAAQTSGGGRLECVTASANMVQAARSIGPASHITFNTDQIGNCTGLTVDNDSRWKPMVP